MSASSSNTVAAPGEPLDQPSPAVSKPLGERLLDAGLLTQPQLDLALSEQKRQGKRLGQVLVDLGFVPAEVIAGTLANESNTELVDIGKTVLDDDLLKLVKRDVALKHKLLPLSLKDGVLTVALADAFDVVAIDRLERETGYTIQVVTAPEDEILEAVAKHYEQSRSIGDTIELIVQGGLASEEDPEDGSPLVRLVDQIIALGIKSKATDIHIEPDERILRVRLRIDGVLRQEALLPKQIQPAVTARIKLLADLDITEKRAPQDGRIHFVFGNSKVDLRVSTLPTNHGESIVMRILDGGRVTLALADLGYSQSDQKLIESLVSRPHGMVLVTGPTGSGKTTTLYTTLGLIDTASKSVFTLEDPIEYSLGMIRQTQVRSDLGMDFASGLRALLRQDPDVILIGEIRDTETAQLAVRAALTGHLVLSTLHTNDAIGAIPRLIDMGIEPYLLPSSLAAIVGQRLVRRNCETCKESAPVPEALLENPTVRELIGETREVWQGRGCDACRNTGFDGRLAIYEILSVDDDLHAPIVQGAPASELLKIARQNGMRSMVEDGVQKALAGHTTLAEVLRVAR
jgi:type IV pilus assembly protein PilB